MWDRAKQSLTWWPASIASIQDVAPGDLLECPWSIRAKLLRSF